VASVTNKPNDTDNQDSAITAENKDLNWRSVVVADGIGSSEYAAEASTIVVQEIKNLLETHKGRRLNLNKIFAAAKSRLIERAKEVLGDQFAIIDKANSFGTTLTVAVETSDRFVIGYTGNGAIWHIKGNFNSFEPTQYLPWNAVNCLSPHSFQRAGREVLYKFFSVSDDFDQVKPGIIEIHKDHRFGDIIMICTDGIYSYDQVQIGKDVNERLWISGEETMQSFYAQLDHLFFDGNPRLSQADFEGGMRQYLERLKAEGLIEDDATLGIIISQEALRYQESRKARITEQDEDH
jgi:serine/threonine protein phosphatase PrpC